jgi:hypothetical protein
MRVVYHQFIDVIERSRSVATLSEAIIWRSSIRQEPEVQVGMVQLRDRVQWPSAIAPRSALW